MNDDLILTRLRSAQTAIAQAVAYLAEIEAGMAPPQTEAGLRASRQVMFGDTPEPPPKSDG